MFDLAIVFAILSLMFGGLIEVVFKRYSTVERSRGVIICGAGVIWSVLLVLENGIREESFVFNIYAWEFGIAAGVSIAVANILLLEALKHMEVSLGSTIYRLNTIMVVILSVLLLGESFTVIKFIGIAFGVFAVLLLHQHHHSTGQAETLKLGLTLVITGALMRATYGVVTKAGLMQGADAGTLMLISALSWIVLGFSYAFFVEKSYAITRQKIAYSLASGCLVYAIVKTLVTALTYGEASVVITIANLSFLMALFVALLLKMERLSIRKVAAMSFAVAAIAVLTQT